MPFLTRPHFEDRQIVQWSGETISLSGQTYIDNQGYIHINGPLLDFTGSTSASTQYVIAGVTGYVNIGEPSSFIVEPPTILQSGSTGTTTVDVTGYILGGLDATGRVTWYPASTFLTGSTSNPFTGNTGPYIFGSNTGDIIPLSGSNTTYSNFSVILGGAGNEISGTSTTSQGSTIVNGLTNDIINSRYSFIGGGQNNLIQRVSSFTQYNSILNGNTNIIYMPVEGTYNTILGGLSNAVSGTNQTYCLIGTGTLNNMVQGGNNSITILNGNSNIISASSYSTIVNGLQNELGSAVAHSVINSGKQNKIIDTLSTATYDLIGSGSGNTVYNSSYSEITNGRGNYLSQSLASSIINGGYNNLDSSNAATIINGIYNTIISGSNYSSIMGGSGNTVNQHTYASIIGGRDNTIHGPVEIGVHETIIGSKGCGITGTSNSSSYSTIIGSTDSSIFESYKSIVLNTNNNTVSSSQLSFIFGGDGEPNTFISSNESVSFNSAGVYASNSNDLKLFTVSQSNFVGINNPFIINSADLNLNSTGPWLMFDSAAIVISGGTTSDGGVMINTENSLIDSVNYQSTLINSLYDTIVGNNDVGITNHVGNLLLNTSGNTIYAYGIGITNDTHFNAIINGIGNTINSGNTFINIIGGSHNTIGDDKTKITVLGVDNLTNVSSNTTYVPNLNIGIIGTGTSVINLGLDANGFVVTGTTGGGSSGSTNYYSRFTSGGTISNGIIRDNGISIVNFMGTDNTAINIVSPVGYYYPSLSFYNNGANPIGSITGYNNELYINGGLKVHPNYINLPYHTPNTLLYTNANNYVLPVTIGSNLSFSSGTLSVTGLTSGGSSGPTIDPYYPQPSTTTFTWDVSGNSTNYQTTLTGNTTLNLTNVRNGEYGTIIVQQDAVGSRTLTFGTVNGAASTHRVVNGGGGSPTLTATANAIDILSFTYNGSAMYWTVGNDYT